MDLIESLGLRIDEKENLRIISSETEKGSLEISVKTKLLLKKLSLLNEQLDSIISILNELDKKNKDMKTNNIASRINELVNLREAARKVESDK